MLIHISLCISPAQVSTAKTSYLNNQIQTGRINDMSKLESKQGPISLLQRPTNKVEQRDVLKYINGVYITTTSMVGPQRRSPPNQLQWSFPALHNYTTTAIERFSDTATLQRGYTMQHSIANICKSMVNRLTQVW